MKDSNFKRFLVKIIKYLCSTKGKINSFTFLFISNQKSNFYTYFLKVNNVIFKTLFLKKLKIIEHQFKISNKNISPHKLRKIILNFSRLGILPESYRRNIAELNFINENYEVLKPLFNLLNKKSILFCGQQYYHHSNLSKYLKIEGWDAIIYDWDMNSLASKNYHYSDFHIDKDLENDPSKILVFYMKCIYRYRIFHFSNVYGISFGYVFNQELNKSFDDHFEINLLKKIGKKIIYTHTGCLDGVSKSSYDKDSNFIACRDCRWNDDDEVCSDKNNLKWGKIRNKLSDYQFCFGASFEDYNMNNSIIETPLIYNIDSNFWNPSNSKNKIKERDEKTVYLYHTIANSKLRTSKSGRNIKSSHIYLPLIDKLKKYKNYKLELINPNNVINREIRYYIMKSDIVLDMLSFGWYGATSREALMLGKPVICYLNPTWLERVENKFPKLVQEMPIISANENNIEEKLIYLIENPELRKEIGRKSRKFALKWHSTKSAIKYFKDFYYKLD